MQFSAPIPISKTKISIPAQRPENIARQRLLDLLSDQLDKKVVLVTAPAGYGKTSLLVDLAHYIDIPTCWLWLDGLDQEPQRFLSYLIACITRAFPTFGDDSLAALHNLVSIEQDSEQMIVALTNEIQAKIHEHFVIVLDDFHHVNAVDVIQNMLNRFFQISGENVHVILASRSLPDMPGIPLLIARDQIAGISFEELAFQPAEIQNLFRKTQPNITYQDAEKLALETEGWIAAIHLSRSGNRYLPIGQTAGHGGNLFDFFNQEILAQQPREVRDFLLHSSVFDVIDVEICKAVLEPVLKETHDWQTLLNTARRNILFTVSVGEEGQFIRYHQLFRHFLQSQLQFEEPARAWHLQRELARYYEQKQAWEDALQLNINLNDRESIHRIFSAIGTKFLQGGRVLTLAAWLDRLPITIFQEYPTLLSLQGIVYATQGDTQMAISLLSQAEALFRENGDTKNLALTFARRAFAYRRQGDYQNCLNDVEAALSLTRLSHEREQMLTYAEAERLKGQALFRLGQPHEALNLLEDAIKIFSHHHEENTIPILEMEMGMIYRSLGDIQNAIYYYDRARERWEKSGNHSWLALLLNNMGALLHATGQIEQSVLTLEDSIGKAERSGDRRTQALAYHGLGEVLDDLQDLEQSGAYFESSLELARKMNDTFIVNHIKLAKIKLARQSQQFDLARQIIAEMESDQSNYSIHLRALLDIEKGCTLLATGQAREACEMLVIAREWLETSGSKIDAATAQIWQTAALAQTDLPAAVEEFGRLIATINGIQAPGRLLTNINLARPWLGKILQSKDPVFQQFFQKVDDFTGSFAALRRKLRNELRSIAISPPSLQIYTLGTVRVLRNGEQVTIADWQTRETRDLFLFLLCSPPHTKEEIANIFWPDISPERLKMRFKTNIYRLRHAVGQDVVQFADDRYQFNPAIDYTWDRIAFESLLAAIEQETEVARLMEMLQAAVDMVNGPYMADIDADWVLEERAQIESLYLSILTRLAEIYLENQKIENSLETCQKALKVDPLLEDAYRISMRAYAVRKDRVGLARQYKQCQDFLQNELGIRPSRETISLYENLLNQL